MFEDLTVALFLISWGVIGGSRNSVNQRTVTVPSHYNTKGEAAGAVQG